MAGFADSLPFFGSAVSQLFGSQASAASAQGSMAAAGSYQEAARIAFNNARLAGISGAIKATQIGRQIMMASGKLETQVAGSGFTQGGSAGDVIRMAAMQGGLAKAVQSVDTELQVASFKQQGTAYEGQAAAATGAAAAASASSGGGLLGALFSGAGGLFALFSDDRLKENIELVEKRDEGINIYTFNFVGTGERWRGVLAQEVQRFKPWCVEEMENGYLMVDYAKLGLEDMIAGVAHA